MIQLLCFALLILVLLPVETVKADTHENSNRFTTLVQGGYHRARVSFKLDGKDIVENASPGVVLYQLADTWLLQSRVNIN